MCVSMCVGVCGEVRDSYKRQRKINLRVLRGTRGLTVCKGGRTSGVEDREGVWHIVYKVNVNLNAIGALRPLPLCGGTRNRGRAKQKGQKKITFKSTHSWI